MWVAVLVAAATSSPQRLKPAFPVWTLSSLERVGIAGTKAAPQELTPIELFAARGEYEAFQIVVQGPPGGLKNVDVELSDLNGPGEHSIERSNFTPYREHFVTIQVSSPDWKGSNRPLPPGRYPDALIPLRASAKTARSPKYHGAPFPVKEGTIEVVWVDVLVPRDAPAGEYHGAARVTSDRGAVSIPLKLTVWNFELPVKSSLKSIFGLQNAIGRNGIEEILRHRITPRISPATRAENGLRDRDLIDRFGLSLVDAGFWSGADRDNCNMRRAPPESDFRRAARGHDSDLMLINYTADEIDGCTHLHTPLKQWARSMHAAGIRNLVVMKPTPDLFDDGSGTGCPAVDIWVVLPVMFEEGRDQIAAALARGHEVWSYNTLVQDPYSPKWLIDFEPINLRIQPGFLNQSLNLTGLLYWRMDDWRRDPWSSTDNSGVYGSGNYPGEGVLIYPGAPAGVSGVVPSIRLKQLRDGVEDYEYVEILKRLGRGDWAREVSSSVAADWKRWSRNPADLLAARKKLGEEIHRRSAQIGSLQ